MINKISFVVCLSLVLDVYACKAQQRGSYCSDIRTKTCLGIHDDKACARLDPEFKDFENFFDIEKVRSDRRLDSRCEDIGMNYTFYVTPKVKISLESIFFRFDMVFADSSFRKSPIDVVESFKKMVATIHKNPSFEKWLEKNARERAEKKEPHQLLVYENVAVIDNQKDMYVKDYGWEPIENVWNKIGMSSKYIGALAFCKTPNGCSRVVRCGFPKFLLGDNGDVFFPEKWNLKKEKILDVSQNEIASYASLKQCEDQKTSKGILAYIEDFLCDHSLVSETRCKEWRSKYYKYCDYLIIRHDGTIEYGPKSGDL